MTTGEWMDFRAKEMMISLAFCAVIGITIGVIQMVKDFKEVRQSKREAKTEIEPKMEMPFVQPIKTEDGKFEFEFQKYEFKDGKAYLNGEYFGDIIHMDTDDKKMQIQYKGNNGEMYDQVIDLNWR